jgi:RNA polymerase sigma-70 factor (ECF subfamily)
LIQPHLNLSPLGTTTAQANRSKRIAWLSRLVFASTSIRIPTPKSAFAPPKSRLPPSGLEPTPHRSQKDAEMKDKFEDSQLILTYLINETVRGNKDAERQLVLIATPYIMRIARQLMKHEQNAEDLTQDVLMKIMRNIGRLDSPAAFYKWVHRITFNMGLNMLRKGKRNGKNSSEYDDQVLGNEIDPAESFYSKETAEVVQQCLEALPEKTRNLIQLRYFEGLKEKELAEVLDVPQGTVKSRLHKANKVVREILESVLAV